MRCLKWSEVKKVNLQFIRTAVPITGIWPSEPQTPTAFFLWSDWLADFGCIEGIVLKGWTHSRWSRHRTTWTLCEVIPRFCPELFKRPEDFKVCIKRSRSMFLNCHDCRLIICSDNVLFLAPFFVLCERHLIVKNIDKELQASSVSLAVYKVLFQTCCL